MEEIKNYILFPSYNSGLALEALLKRDKIRYTIVPTPRELSSCCGISMLYEKTDEETICKLAKENGISLSGFKSFAKVYKDFYGLKKSKDNNK